MNIALAYGGALSAALCATALMQRFGVSPIAAAQGTRVPSAGRAFGFAQLAAATTHVLPQVDRKADDRVPPRGRRH